MRTAYSATTRDLLDYVKEEARAMQYLGPFTDKLNVLAGIVVAIFNFVFGEHWMFFALFLVLNVLDYLTGIMKAWKLKILTSKIGARGIIRKTSYWIIIALGFMVSAIFIEIGTIMEADLRWTTLIGWITLFTLIVNEMRSILENLVKYGIKVPRVLISGLKAADNITDSVADKLEQLGDGKEEDDDAEQQDV